MEVVGQHLPGIERDTAAQGESATHYNVRLAGGGVLRGKEGLTGAGRPFAGVAGGNVPRQG